MNMNFLKSYKIFLEFLFYLIIPSEKVRRERMKSGMGVSSFYRNGTSNNGGPSNVQASERTPLLGATSSKDSNASDVTFKIPGKSESGAGSTLDPKKDELPASLFKVRLLASLIKGRID